MRRLRREGLEGVVDHKARPPWPPSTNRGCLTHYSGERHTQSCGVRVTTALVLAQPPGLAQPLPEYLSVSTSPSLPSSV